MGALSNQLLTVAVLTYLVAMVCHAAEYAFGTRGPVARAAARPRRELAAVGAGARGTAAAPEPETAPTTASATPADAKRHALAGRIALAATVLAAVLHVGAVVTRGIAARRMTWGNMYEFVLTLTLVGVVAWLVVLTRRPAIRRLGLFVTLALVLLLGVAGMVLYTPVGPLMPALKSVWFIVHVSMAATASGIFLLGFVTGVIYLLRAGYEQGKRSFPYPLARWAPESEALERLTFRLHAFAFPIWTFAIASGAVWAEAAWGRYWGWDPKETWSFISWVVYAGYLHARATPSVKRRTATWIAILGFLTMMMNLIGVNLFFEGLHSYSGL